MDACKTKKDNETVCEIVGVVPIEEKLRENKGGLDMSTIDL